MRAVAADRARKVHPVRAVFFVAGETFFVLRRCGATRESWADLRIFTYIERLKKGP